MVKDEEGVGLPIYVHVQRVKPRGATHSQPPRRRIPIALDESSLGKPPSLGRLLPRIPRLFAHGGDGDLPPVTCARMRGGPPPSDLHSDRPVHVERAQSIWAFVSPFGEPDITGIFKCGVSIHVK